jgi:AraC-like DNA-binding protein
MPRPDTLNIARLWQDPTTRGLSLMHADFRTQEYAPHRHEALVVAATELGGSVIRSRGIVSEADTANLFVFNPAEPHSGRMGASRRWRYRAFYLDADALASLGRGLGIESLPYFTANRFADPGLMAAFLALHRAIESGHEGLRERELLLTSFGALFRRHGSFGRRIPPAMRDRAHLRAAAAIIRARLGEKLSLGLLAAALGLTEFQLIGLFKRTTGLTPHAYITQLRLDHARDCLAGGLPIAEAALAAGFYDQSALTRHFKRCYAVTPLQFASLYRRS